MTPHPTPIEKRLRASVGFDAINGDVHERLVCGKQMLEAAETIERLRKQLSDERRDSQQDARDAFTEGGWQERQGEDYGSY